jgi:TM2 domain-containing membrane protein YozV
LIRDPLANLALKAADAGGKAALITGKAAAKLGSAIMGALIRRESDENTDDEATTLERPKRVEVRRIEREPELIESGNVPRSECPFCGEAIKAHAKKCKHCGEILDPVLRMSQEGSKSSVVHVTQVNNNNNAGFGPRWSRIVAMLLSFLMPGLGQMYKGQVFNGIAWFFVVAVGYVFFIFPGIILHFICVIGAAMGDPYR